MPEVKMTDAELVRRVAEKVMGWEANPPCLSEWPSWKTADDQAFVWRPLTDWNDTWIVVEAMRARGRGFAMHDQSDDDGLIGGTLLSFMPTRNWPRSFVKYGQEQRAILEAALAAVEASK